MAVEQFDLSDDDSFDEVDPSGRFGRYSELLGSGAVKEVYIGFDRQEGKEIAWNKVKLRRLCDDPAMIDRLKAEIKLLRSLQSENIISFCHVWRDNENRVVNFITEVCNSGDLRKFRKRYNKVSIKALKKWSRQILEGLNYLHTHEPCIIHRDLNCSNIYVNGNTGKVKLGDFGLATIVGEDHIAHSMIGTPEYMAPELYEGTYTETIDIYAYGMCVLELVTKEIPYSECNSIAQVYRKVSSGIMPDALYKVRNAKILAFIEKCIGQPRARPSAAELLKDPFFMECDDDDTSVAN